MFEKLDIVAPYVLLANAFVSPTEYLKHLADENKKMPYCNVPMGAQLELTYKCNQRCIHCYNNSASETLNYTSMLSASEWRDVVQQLKDMKIMQCIISGGEPLVLGDLLFELMDILHEAKVKFIVISNGMLLNEANVLRFKKYAFDWFQISIDGFTAKTHDTIRGVSSWDKAIEATYLLKKHNVPLVVAHAVTKINLHEIDDMIDLAYKLGARRIVISPFELVGRAISNVDKLELSKDEMHSVYTSLKKKHEIYVGKMEVSVPPETVVSVHANLYQKNSVLLFRPNGDIKFDCMSPFKIGNTRNDKISDVWKHLGRTVNEHTKVKEYANSITSQSSFLSVYPRINLDDDELLEITH